MQKKTREVEPSWSQVTVTGVVEYAHYGPKWFRFSIRDGDQIFNGECRRHHLQSRRPIDRGVHVVVTGHLAKTYDHQARRHRTLIQASLISAVDQDNCFVARPERHHQHQN